MKVLTARILVWLLDKVATRLLNWIADLEEDWAWLADELPEGIWIRADYLKPGGTSSED